MKLKTLLTTLAAAVGLTTAAVGATTTERVISLNIHNAQGTGSVTADASTMIGDVPAAAWVNFGGSAGSHHAGSQTGLTGWSGTETETFSSATLSWRTAGDSDGVNNIYEVTAATLPYMKRVYARGNGTGVNDARFVVSSIPYTNYDLIIYIAGTTTPQNPIKVNDKYYVGNTSVSPYGTSETSSTSGSWGSNLNGLTATTYGKNVLRIKDLTASEITVMTPNSNSGWGLAAIQIVETEPAVASTATVSTDTDWSKIVWTPAITDPATAELELTVENNAVITLDTTPEYASLKVTGTLTINTDSIVGEDLAKNAVCGAPYSYWFFSKKVDGTIKASTLPDMPTGYTVTEQEVSDYGARLVVTAPAAAKFGAVSMNLHNGTALSTGSTLSGAYPIAHDSWGNLQASANKAATVDGVTFTVGSSASGWNINTYSDEIYLQYMDDSSTTRTISLSGITYEQYRIIVYFSTDTANYNFCPMVVNDGTADVSYAGPSTGTTGGNTVKGRNANWGHSGPDKNMNAVAEGVNYLVTDVMTTTTPVLKFTRAGDPRATPCAIQVVKVGEYISKTDYAATVSAAGTFDLSDLAWGTTFNPGEKDSATITIDSGVTGEVTINLDKADMSIDFIKVISAGAATVKVTGNAPTAINTWNLSEAVGTVTMSVSTGSAAVTAGTDTVVPAGGTGTLTIGANMTATIMDGQWSGTLSKAGTSTLRYAGTTTVTGNFPYKQGDSGTVIYAAPFAEITSDDGLQFACGLTRKFEDGFSLSTTRLVLGNQQVYTQNFTQDGGSITITGSAAPTSTSASTLFAHWNSTVNYTMNDGTFTAENAAIRFGWDGKIYFTMNGGTLRTKGIASGGSGSTGRNNSASFTMNGGTLELGDYGLQAIGSSAAYTFAGGTIKAYADTTITVAHTDGMKVTGPVTIDVNGCALTVAANITGSGNITVIDSSAGKTGTISFTGDISGYTGAISVSADVKEVTLGTARPTNEFTFGGATAVKFAEKISEDGIVPSLTLASGSATPTYKVIGIDGNEKEISGGKYVPTVTGKAAIRAYEFNGDLSNAGSDGTGNLGKDNGPYYKGGTEIFALSQPYQTITWPEEFTVSIHATLPDLQNACLVAWGTLTAGGIGLTTGDPTKNEVKMVYWPSSQAYTTLATMTVPNAQSVKHLYVFTKTADTLKIYLDGSLVVNYSGAYSLGGGFQVGSVHGGIGDTGLGRLDIVYDTKTDTNLCYSVINSMRIYDTVLGANAMAALVAEFPYQSPNGTFTRALVGADNEWVATDAWTKVGEAEKFSAPESESTVNLTAADAATVTLNLDAPVDFEAMNLTGDGTITIAAAAANANKISCSGTATIGANAVIEYSAMSLASTPITIAPEKTLTIDASMIDLTKYFADTTVTVTGLVTADDVATQLDCTLPESVGGRTVAFAKNESNNTYELQITVPENAFNYADGTWKWGDSQTVDAETVSNNTANAVVVKSGTLEWTLDRASFTVEGGTLKAAAAPTAASAITVESGAAFDLNGIEPTSEANNYTVTLNGGTLANSGEAKGLLKALTLTADSTIDAGAGIIAIQSQHGGWAATTLDLGAHTLAKTGSFRVEFVMTTVSGTGTIYAQEGTLWVQETSSFGDALIKLGAAGTFEVRSDASKTATLVKVESVAGGQIVANDTATVSAFTLTGTLTLSGTGTFGTITLNDGAVLNEGEKRGLTLDGAGTVNVTLTADEHTARKATLFTQGGSVTVGTVTYGGKDIADKCAFSADGASIVDIEQVVPISGNITATVLAGDCEVTGDGELTASTLATLKEKGVTNLVIGSGITSIGASAFKKWQGLRSVELGSGCATIASDAFFNCRNLTNVTCSATSVGDYAFYRCNSLEKMTFTSKPEFGEQSFTFQTAIYMEGGIPKTYTIPAIEIKDYNQQLQGSTDLSTWTDITTEAQKSQYNFFRIVFVQK